MLGARLNCLRAAIRCERPESTWLRFSGGLNYSGYAASSSQGDNLSLSSKVITCKPPFEIKIPEPTIQPIPIESARVNFFSEEIERIQVPTTSSLTQTVVDILYHEKNVHVLLDSPVGICTFKGLDTNESLESASPEKRISFSKTISWLSLEHLLPEAPQFPHMMIIDSMNLMGLFLPKMNALILFSASGGKANVINLPKQPAKTVEKSKGGDMFSGRFFPMLGKGKSNDNVTRIDSCKSNSGILLLFNTERDELIQSFDVLEIKMSSEGKPLPSFNRVYVPGDAQLNRIESYSERKWLARGAMGELYWLLYEDFKGSKDFVLQRINICKLSEPEIIRRKWGDGTEGDCQELMHHIRALDSRDTSVIPIAGVSMSVSKIPPLANPSTLMQRLRESYLTSVPHITRRKDWVQIRCSWSGLTNQTVSVNRYTGSDPKSPKYAIQVIDETHEIISEVRPLNAKSLAEENDSGTTVEPEFDIVGLCQMNHGKIGILERHGSNAIVRTFVIDQSRLKTELEEWKKMVGASFSSNDALNVVNAHHQPLRLSVQQNGSRVGAQGGVSSKPPPIDEAKHGKEDPTNTPHVGGNTWAGGTGGSNTAGLGGRGGPYRLDKGHPVHQVSEEDKRAVSMESQRRARELNRQAFQERLKEIEMSMDEHDEYLGYFQAVESEISQMRTLLDGLETRRQERIWLKHQSFGDLDDSKLVDGVAGEKLVYKRRGLKDDNKVNTPGKKRIRIVVDASGSMYRFNGLDGRLRRECELVVMLMEALDGFESRFEYSIVAHSGESDEIVLVDYNSPPASQKDRLRVILSICAHSQFCYSGDQTFEATEKAIENVYKEESEEAFVFVISDANLRRYGQDPQDLGDLLLKRSSVMAYAIFIASFAEEATRLVKELPQGRGFVLLDNADLPTLFRQIFSSNVLHQGEE